MSIENKISEHYTHGDLLAAIESALFEMSKTVDTVTEKDLGPVGEFHIGGRIATDNLLDQLAFTEQDHILDIGCGIGGTARHIASRLNNKVTGIDLTDEYILVGKALTDWVGLGNHVQLHHGSALDLPFEDDMFDGAVMLHVGMNIEDKATLFKEAYRVLKPGANFGIYDVMQISHGELFYPIPWAENSSNSYLASPQQYLTLLKQANFITCQETMRRYFALDFFNTMQERTQEGPPPLGLHTLMQDTVEIKIQNMIKNIKAGFISPFEIISHKPLNT